MVVVRWSRDGREDDTAKGRLDEYRLCQLKIRRNGGYTIKTNSGVKNINIDKTL